MKFAVIDYGASNMFSLLSSLRRLNVDVDVISKKRDLGKYSAIILPGVGSFSSACEKMEKVKNKIIDAIEEGIPLLGICLGLQLMFKRSEEGPGDGLGILEGEVIRFSNGVKIPHMGWNSVKLNNDSILLNYVYEPRWVYFAHSYYPEPKDDSIKTGTTFYGSTFTSVVEKKNLFGTQFHPEKSGDVGKKILENFIKYAKR
jgi:glutamine amidotransferase